MSWIQPVPTAMENFISSGPEPR